MEVFVANSIENVNINLLSLVLHTCKILSALVELID